MNEYRYLVEEKKGYTADGTPLFYIEISGDSSWTKPTTASTGDAICDGSLCLESDTGTWFAWNEKTEDWAELG